MEAVAALLEFFIGLALVHFQKYWLLMLFQGLASESCIGVLEKQILHKNVVSKIGFLEKIWLYI